MVRTGEVVEKDGEVLWVVFERPEACSHCNACLHKGQCTRVEIRGEAEVGDSIEVEMPETKIVGASLLAYMVPLALLIVGMVLGAVLHAPLAIAMDANLFAALCGLVLLAVGFGFVHGIDRVLRKRRGWQPRIIAVHKPKP